MKLPQASMTTTLFVILVFAVAFGIARGLQSQVQAARFATLGLGFLPMATALVFGAYRLLRLRERSGAFAVGFEVAGLAATGGYLAAIQTFPAFLPWLGRTYFALNGRLRSVLPPVPNLGGGIYDAYSCLVLATLFSLPLLLIAISAGAIARQSAREAERARVRTRKKPRATTGHRVVRRSARAA